MIKILCNNKNIFFLSVLALFGNLCTLISAISDTMIYTIPAGELVNTFEPSPSNSLFQRDVSYHCFDLDTNGNPTYVRAVTSGYFYFEGNIASDGSITAVIYMNDLRFGYYPIVGSISLNYTTDFTEVNILSTSCQPSYLCDRWVQTGKLTSGQAPTGTFNSPQLCFYNRTASPGSLSAVVSEFSSDQGQTYFCSNPTYYNPNAVNGSWLYINALSDCSSRGLTYPCPNNTGPYTNGIGETLPDGKGFIATQWYGFGFGNPDEQNGRSLFAAATDTYITGSYCVYNDTSGLIKFCYPEDYYTSPSESASEAECATYWEKSTTIPASSTSPYKLTTGDIIGIIIGCVVALAVVTSFAIYRPHVSICESIFTYFHQTDQSKLLAPRDLKI